MRSKKEINIEIGKRIKDARESNKMTQEQLAEAINVSPQYLSDLERGVVGLSIQTLKNVCHALRVSSDTILFSVDTDNLSVLESKMNCLSPEQRILLMDIIDRFIAAVNL